MFRLFLGEIKKIFLSPAIFIMAGVLILFLAVSPQLFSPIHKVDSSTITLPSSSVIQVYDKFTQDYKTSYNSQLQEQIYYTNQILEDNTKVKDILLDLFDTVYENRTTFHETIIKPQDVDERNIALLNLSNSAKELWNTYLLYRDGDVTNPYPMPLFFVDKETNDEIEMVLATNFIRSLEPDGNTLDEDYYLNIDEVLSSNTYLNEIKALINKIENIELNNDILKTKLNYVLDKNQEITKNYEKAIVDAYNKASGDDAYNLSDENIKAMQELVIDYVASYKNAINIINNNLKIQLATNKSDAEMSNFIGYEGFSSYEYNETLVKSEYLLENGLGDGDFANSLAFNKTSNVHTNAYDYMYFALEIISFVVIAFTVVLGAGMIAKEQSNGTIKLLAIRPYNRHKIMFSKILATMFFAFVFVLISFIVTFITGAILYGTTSLDILAVFNATTPLVISPITMMLIYMVCMLIKILVFIMLTFFISTIFKSYVAAVSVSVFVYVANLIITFIGNGANWLKYNIFANLDLFKFFGGAFINKYTENGNFLTNMFLSPVFSDTGILYVGILVSALILVLGITTFAVFKNRDIT